MTVRLFCRNGREHVWDMVPLSESGRYCIGVIPDSEAHRPRCRECGEEIGYEEWRRHLLLRRAERQLAGTGGTDGEEMQRTQDERAEPAQQEEGEAG